MICPRKTGTQNSKPDSLTPKLLSNVALNDSPVATLATLKLILLKPFSPHSGHMAFRFLSNLHLWALTNPFYPRTSFPPRLHSPGATSIKGPSLKRLPFLPLSLKQPPHSLISCINSFLLKPADVCVPIITDPQDSIGRDKGCV